MSHELQLTDWMPCTTPPVREGEFEVVYTADDIETDVGRDKFRAEFIRGAWFDVRGHRLPGLCHDPENFSWRGVRRWVLVYWFTDAPPSYMTKLTEDGCGQYYSADLSNAMGFDDAGDALFFAFVHNVRFVKAVLP